MLSSRSLPKKADIFTKTKNTAVSSKYYKLFKTVTFSGIIMSGIGILLGTAVFLLPQQQIHTLLAPATKQAESANTYGGDMRWGESGNDGWQQYQNSNNNNGNFTPFPSIQPQFQTISTNISPVPSIAPLNPNQPGGQDLGGISDQIVQIQQQISQQMQSCVSNAQQMANQIIQLQNQQKQLQQQLDALNNQQMPNFDIGTTQGQQQQQQWQQQQQQQQQQLQNQIDNLSNQISTAQNNMNTANSNCQQNVTQLEQNRGQLEQNLDQAFSNAMNIQIPNQ